MHKTGRNVRFSINPFLPSDSEGFNSFVSKPAGEGLSVFFELSVELSGNVEADTGFVVNVIDIDKNVREYAVPIFAKCMREDYQQSKHIGLLEIAELLRLAWENLTDKFGTAKLSKLSIKLNPFRKVEIESKDTKMFYFSEKFEFAATHKLWNEQFGDERNFEIFGKCANPTGHGHNYIVEVTIRISPRTKGNKQEAIGDFCIGDFERIVDNELIKELDHKNLNADVTEFKKTNPTVENIASFAWNKITDKFSAAELHCVTVWETDKTYCSYYKE